LSFAKASTGREQNENIRAQVNGHKPATQGLRMEKEDRLSLENGGDSDGWWQEHSDGAEDQAD
jgi:hypothetical protein